jgi:CRISPR/Cas system Type II protein with McrA/HNH and RuvC-like nuclease domain
VSLNIESLSDKEKVAFLSRLAHEITICARDTYEVGTDDVLAPEILRGYNELMHRVTGAVVDHLVGAEGYSLKVILEMAREFGKRFNRVETMKWAIDSASRKTFH